MPLSLQNSFPTYTHPHTQIWWVTCYFKRKITGPINMRLHYYWLKYSCYDSVVTGDDKIQFKLYHVFFLEGGSQKSFWYPFLRALLTFTYLMLKAVSTVLDTITFVHQKRAYLDAFTVGNNVYKHAIHMQRPFPSCQNLSSMFLK